MLVVVNGPIGSGKSTFSAALADVLRTDGKSVAVVGLDEVFFMIRSFPNASLDEMWDVARIAHAGLVRAFMASGVAVIVAEGPFFEDAHRELLLGGLGGVDPFWITLTVSYDEALRRVALDETRGVSKDPDFLRMTHDNFWSFHRSSDRRDLLLYTHEATARELAALVAEQLPTRRAP
jgi:tRNA uridine 5-carbamoylmethylation protein Kti12